MIKDCFNGLNKNLTTIAYFHLHPKVRIKILDKKILLNDNIELLFSGSDLNISVKDYLYSSSFNIRSKSNCICIKFKNRLNTVINII